MPDNSSPAWPPPDVLPPQDALEEPNALDLHDAAPLRRDSPLVAVLAGGGSRRFGRPKELADLGGRSMVEYPVAAARATGLPVALAGGDPALADRLDLPHLPDAAGVVGPIGGLLSALEHAIRLERQGVILLGADMPLYPAGLITVVAIEAARERSRALGLRTPDGHLQTLGAFYPAARLERLAAIATSPEPSLKRAFGAADGRALVASSEVLSGFDLDVACRNVNTPEDLARVVALLG